MKKNSESTKTAIKFFKQFLVTNNALEGYLAGLRAEAIFSSNTQSKVYSPKTLICHAFVWADTKEGFEYWSGLSRQWSKVCDALNL